MIIYKEEVNLRPKDVFNIGDIVIFDQNNDNVNVLQDSFASSSTWYPEIGSVGIITNIVPDELNATRYYVAWFRTCAPSYEIKPAYLIDPSGDDSYSKDILNYIANHNMNDVHKMSLRGWGDTAWYYKSRIRAFTTTEGENELTCRYHADMLEPTL